MVGPPPSADDGKVAWRRWARGLARVDDATVRRVGRHVDELVAAADGPVLGFVALPDEVAAVPDQHGTVLVLPRLAPDGSMTLHRDDGDRERHPLGFGQPPATAPTIDPEELALVLVPARLFDRDGYRLGRGGGHYDRLLSRLRPSTSVVGVTCRARVVERLPREPHDVPMTHLVTEDGTATTNPTPTNSTK